MKTIAVVDSGVGGLSVLRALQCAIPDAHWIYLADSAFAPYGDRNRQEVKDRVLRIAAWLTPECRLDALVMACNTATALAIDGLRSLYPVLPIVGVEPALKTAVRESRTGYIGVMATSATLGSDRFVDLRRKVEADSGKGFHFLCQPCPGLADAIERDDGVEIEHLCRRYVTALLERVPGPERLDCLVLGCTHYPFAMPTLQGLCGSGVHLIDNARPVATRTANLVGAGPANTVSHTRPEGRVSLYTTGSLSVLKEACERWLPQLRLHAASQVHI